MNLIFITGPSGSGKTTISKYISQYLTNSYILSTDNYYKTGLISKISSKIIKSYFDKIISHDQGLIKNDIDNIIKNNLINEIEQLTIDFTEEDSILFLRLRWDKTGLLIPIN